MSPQERGVAVDARTGTGEDGASATSLAVRVHRARDEVAVRDDRAGDLAAADADRLAGVGGSAVLVHGLASNARMWDACAERLARHGTPAVALDLRGHGRSATPAGQPQGPFTTATAAADVVAVTRALLADGTLRAPVVLAGQSWGGNVALRAATTPGHPFGALALVDGGWLRFDRSEPFERLWARLAPPTWAGTRLPELRARLETAFDGWGPHAVPAVLGNLTADEHGAVRNVLPRAAHEQVLRSMYDADPRELYPLVDVPVLLAPAGGGPASRLVGEAVAGLPGARLERYDGAHHDLHLQHPGRLARDLLRLLRSADTDTDTDADTGPRATALVPDGRARR